MQLPYGDVVRGGDEGGRQLDGAQSALDEGIDADQQYALTALRRNSAAGLRAMSQHCRGKVQDHRAQPYGVLRTV